MNFESPSNRISTITTILLTLLSLVKSAHSVTVVLDFDSVVIAGPRTDATAYLNSFGITFVPITPGAAPSIENTLWPGSAAIASSQPNVFDVVGISGPAMVFYRLDFAGPLESVSFTRTAIISTSGDAPWIAKALDAQGNVLASANEGFLIGPSARTFTLIGPGITALEIDARNDISQTTFNTPPIDNLTLVTPEPKNSISFSLGLGILLLGVVYRRSIPKSSVAGFSPEGKRHWSPTA